jgi:hypothetical protein
LTRWVFGRLVAAERAAYDAAWRAAAAAGPGAAAALRELEAWSLRARADRPPPGGLRQTCRDPEAAAAGGPRRVRPADSLDVLYRQAEALNPVLRAKATALARQCGGLLLLRDEDGGGGGGGPAPRRRYAAWGETEEGARVAWAEVKPAERALEKLLRTYGCEVARLLDLCRQVRRSNAGQTRWSNTGHKARLRGGSAAGPLPPGARAAGGQIRWSNTLVKHWSNCTAAAFCV